MWKWLEIFSRSKTSKPIENFPVSLDLRMALDWLLGEIRDRITADQIFWISADEYHAIKAAAATGKYESHQTFFKDLKVRGCNRPDFDNLRRVLCSDATQCIAIQTDRLFTSGFIVLAGASNDNVKIVEDVVRTASRYLNYCIQYEEATRATLRDDLTSLFNQKCMGLVLESEVHRATREKCKFSVLFIDIDHFKSVNDNRGHWVGSHLLARLGGFLSQNVRKSDYAFRYGGDEFVILLPATSSEGAKVAAERLRTKVENCFFNVSGQEIQITLSIGIATFPDHAKSYEDIIKMADEAMYNGKAKSRNIVLLAS